MTEALRAGGFAHETTVHLRWVPSDECETPEGAARHLGDVDGICIPGGFGVRGIEGKVGALRFARENGIPALGLCLGLQCMVIEYARNEAGLPGASSTEFDPDTPFPVIATMAEQVAILSGGDLGGTMRLGLYRADLEEGSLARDVYERAEVSERHRHRYEVNNHYRERLAGRRTRVLRDVARPPARRVRGAAAGRAPVLHRHAGAPGARGRPTRAHPLFRGLIGAALDRQRASRLFDDEAAASGLEATADDVLDAVDA